MTGKMLRRLLYTAVGDPMTPVSAATALSPYWCPGLDPHTAADDEKYEEKWRERRMPEFTNIYVRQREEIDKKADEEAAAEREEKAAEATGAALTTATDGTTHSDGGEDDSAVVDEQTKSRKRTKTGAKLSSHADGLMSDKLYVDLVHVLLQPTLLERRHSTHLTAEERHYWKRVSSIFDRERFYLHYMMRDMKNVDPSSPPRSVPVLCYVPPELASVDVVHPTYEQCRRATPVSDLGRLLEFWHGIDSHHQDCHEHLKAL